MNQTLSTVLSPLLLATDASPSASLAQKFIRPIAKLLQANSTSNAPVLTVVTVQPRLRRAKRLPKPSTIAPARDDQTATTATSAETNSSSTERLAALVQTDFSDIPFTLEVRQGRPATEILNRARSLEAGLIAVGHRGAGGMREILLGSVSTAIARYAPCSVLVARSQSNASAEPSLRHVLLAVDGSPATQRAIDLVRQLIPIGIDQITLLHVQSALNANYLVGPFVSPTPSWQLTRSLQSAQQEQGEHLLQRATATLEQPAITIGTRLQVGDPGPTICQVAQELQVDLVILGSSLTRRSLSPLKALRAPRHTEDSTRSTLRNTRLSVTEDYSIHYAPCSVLLCRTI